MTKDQKIALRNIAVVFGFKIVMYLAVRQATKALIRSLDKGQ